MCLGGGKGGDLKLSLLQQETPPSRTAMARLPMARNMQLEPYL